MDANMDEYLASTLVAHSVNITRSNFNPILSTEPDSSKNVDIDKDL